MPDTCLQARTRGKRAADNVRGSCYWALRAVIEKDAVAAACILIWQCYSPAQALRHIAQRIPKRSARGPEVWCAATLFWVEVAYLLAGLLPNPNGVKNAK